MSRSRTPGPSLTLFCRRRRRKAASATRAMSTAKPPIVPPTIAPVRLLDPGSLSGALVEVDASEVDVEDTVDDVTDDEVVVVLLMPVVVVVVVVVVDVLDDEVEVFVML